MSNAVESSKFAFEVQTRLPTHFGDCDMRIYRDHRDSKEAIVIVYGSFSGSENENVPIRVHDQCFTSEIFGSLKCDCRLQLDFAQQYLSNHGGVLIYLQQEGRGIGLSNKIAAYYLQERGLDTVEANLALGLPSEARNYEVVPFILNDLKISSVSLMTNNPFKISELEKLGVKINGRLSIVMEPHAHSLNYLKTKALKQGHYFDFDTRPQVQPTHSHSHIEKTLSNNQSKELVQEVQSRIQKHSSNLFRRPFITLSYAQSLDGSISASNSAATQISGKKSQQLTHALRAAHDAILIGVGTMIADNPSLTVREVSGPNPRPIIVDTLLRSPLSNKLFQQDPKPILVVSNQLEHNTTKKDTIKHLQNLGVQILFCETDPLTQKINLSSMFRLLLSEYNIKSILVEGGAQIITSLINNSSLSHSLIDDVIIMLSPIFIGGLRPLPSNSKTLKPVTFPKLKNIKSFQLDESDIVISGSFISSNSRL